MMIRIRYSQDESGWAEKLAGNRARIENIPLASDLNIDDEVELIERNGDGLPWAGAVVASVFPCKTSLEYPEPHRENWKRLCASFEDNGCKAEGLVPGLCLVAHTETVDPVLVAKEAGVSVTALADEEKEL